MNLNRFSIINRFIEFDDKSARNERWTLSNLLARESFLKK